MLLRRVSSSLEWMYAWFLMKKYFILVREALCVCLGKHVCRSVGLEVWWLMVCCVSSFRFWHHLCGLMGIVFGFWWTFWSFVIVSIDYLSAKSDSLWKYVVFVVVVSFPKVVYSLYCNVLHFVQFCSISYLSSRVKFHFYDLMLFLFHLGGFIVHY